MTTPNIPTPRTDAEESNTKPKHELFTVWAARGWKLSRALERENVVLRAALSKAEIIITEIECGKDKPLATGFVLDECRKALTPPTTI